MNFFKSDRLFEEAGRSAESCEKLLKRLRRIRLHGLIIFFGTGAVSLGFFVWGMAGAARVLNAMGETVAPSSIPDLPIDASFVRMFTPVILTLLVSQSIWLQHHDALIKMLLILRAQQGLSGRKDAEN